MTCVCLTVACVAVFAACGEEENVKPQYAYYTFDLTEDGSGLVIDVSFASRLPAGALVLPAQSYYYPDERGGEVKEHDTPKDIVCIADGAFEGCDLLTSVSIGGTYRTVGASAFKNCTNLVSVSFPSHEKVTDAPELAIPDGAFQGCRALTAVYGNPVVTSVGARAFDSCLALSSLGFQWKDGFAVGEKAFYFDVSLPSFDLSRAGSVGSRAFGGWDENRITKPQNTDNFASDWNEE